MPGAVLVVARKLAYKHGLWNGSIIAGVAYVVVIAVTQFILPAVNEVPQNFSADVLWHFRISALGTHLVFWVFWGLGFGYLTERSFASKSRPARRIYG